MFIDGCTHENSEPFMITIDSEYYQILRWAAESMPTLIVKLAKHELELANKNRMDEMEWPAGQSWKDLGNSSKQVFVRRACESAEIDPEKYIDLISNHTPDNILEKLDW